MRRQRLAQAVVGVALALPCAPAAAADQRVVATPSNTYSPRVTAVAPGQTATFQNLGGLHDVDWVDPFPSQPPAPGETWTVQRSFSRLGAYRYFCSVHGTARGVGMWGIVYVTPSGAVPPPAIVSLSATGSAGAATLRLNAAEPGRVEAVLYRGAARFGSVLRAAPAGLNSLRLTRTASGRVLTPGRYKLVLRLISGSRRSAARTLFVTVR